MDGKYDSDQVFLGLIQAMVGKADRKERKVGNQNFKYANEVVDFSQLIMTVSPQSYRYMQAHLQLPTIRHLQYVLGFIFPGLVLMQLMTGSYVHNHISSQGPSATSVSCAPKSTLMLLSTWDQSHWHVMIQNSIHRSKFIGIQSSKLMC